ncbi:GerAB/ArcD/ProY family transporter [Thermotalea metallivorans]|uniref:Spore germination protein YndE n=1 Tax=Thermotalea metallivorans TaxID=520762 RepID=A0A140L6M0_9FIRM|nr:endospore germination permease [Thermotalea metallivorans]KXG76195.1 Spore germination protein YndE [Thermotalea metallivorans]
MKRNNDVILSSQLAAILSTTIIGVGILSLPRDVAEGVGPDSWLLILIGSILALIHGLLMYCLVRKFPGETLVEFSQTLLGKVLGKVISFGFCIYLLIFSAVEVRVFGEVTKQYLLFNTPLEVLGITLLILAVYLARSGIEPIARMSEIIFPIATFTAVLIILPLMPELDMSYLKPVLRTPIKKFITTIPAIFFSYVGIEVLLVFSAFVKDPKKIKNGVFLTVGLVTFFYLSITVITITRFGLEETSHMTTPVLELFKTIDIPGAFVENIEAFIMSIWILSVFMTLAVIYYGASLILSRLLGSKEQNYLVLPLMPIIYFLALIPDNVAQLSEYMEKFSLYMGTFYISLVPIALLVISGFKKKKGGNKSA